MEIPQELTCEDPKKHVYLKLIILFTDVFRMEN